MGSSKKHRERGGTETAEEAPAAAGAALAGGSSTAGRPREHRKHRHRGGERRGKRSRSRGERSGGGGGSSGGGGGGGGAEPERRGKRERREEREEPGEGREVKLRAKLGLKPLETTTVKKEAGTKEDPVAADVINPLVQRQREEIREKLAAAKEKRLLNQKLGKIKTLGEDDPWLDDAAAWIERSRKLQQEKELAEKRAKLLEEMDQEFGVSTLVEEEFMRRKRDLYSSRDLQGLTVEHDLGAFREGETLVLTLKDKGVLEESEDVLVNVTLVAEEQAQENAELRKKKPPYVPYEDEDPAAATQVRPLLVSPLIYIFLGGPGGLGVLVLFEPFLGGLGGFGDDWGGGWGNLSPFSPLQSVTFRKTRRRVRRLRRKEKPLRADDLLPLAPGDTRGDFGSRSRGRGRRVQEDEEGAEGEGEPEAPTPPPPGPPPQLPSDDTRLESMDISSEEETQGPSSPPALEEDEAEQELQQQLEKGRRLRQLQQLREAGGEKVLELVRGAGGTPGPDPRAGAIVFNATSEFCRTLGEIPTYGLAGNREEQEELMALERAGRPSPPGAPDSEGEENVGWSSVNLAEERQHQDFSASSTTILDEEPIVNRGLAAALLLCQNKGLLETTVQKVARVKDKMWVMAIDDKYSRREEYRGFTQDFKEKEGYRPDVKIEYVDETGRKLTPKEAFRQLSHRFHGKGSGKMKTERRMKKLDEEALLKKMSSSDTPLGTVALLQEKQKAQKTPYIVLSGSGKSMNANTITK
uniref:Spliceosome associated factor 1, recruiter of U4/U6.U5 tri-snRNP n=1 Tax=Aquila chrysaetos chrysaetos TaxID=223781 RepID=A0A663EIC4_AQUCH